MSRKETAGVFGGSFDPPHHAHVLAVHYAKSAFSLDRVWVIPTYVHALEKEASIPFEHRVLLCKQAFAQLIGVEVLDIEARLPTPSRTLNTLQALQQEHPETKLRLIIGSDILDETSKWHRWDKIVAQAPPIIIRRVGYEDVPENGPAVPGADTLPLCLPRISSTDLRKRLRAGQSLTGYVPASVISFLKQNGIDRPDGES